MSNFAARKPFPVAVGVAALGLLAIWVSTKIFGTNPPISPRATLAHLVPIAVAVLLALVLGLLPRLGWKPRHLAMIFTRGWILLLAGLIIFGLFYFGTDRSTWVRPGVVAVISFVCYYLAVAVFEELLCRGIIQNLFYLPGRTALGVEDEAAEPRYSPWQAVLISSAIFGLIHLANLTANPNLVVSTITQVIYTFAIGCLLGAVYILAGNIWVPIVLHWLFDVLGSISDLLIPAKSGVANAADLPLGNAILQVVIIIPAALVAYLMMAKQRR